MAYWRKFYRVARSILFSITLGVVGLYLLLYLLVTVPAVQRFVTNLTAKELSSFLGGKVEIEEIEIFPFNEVIIHDVRIDSPDGKRVAKIETLGTRLNLYRLVSSGKFEFGYAEIIGLDAAINQPSENAPLNIQFIIDAFAPKDKNKPPKDFDVCLHTIIMRRCKVTFDKLWIPQKKDRRQIDFNHLKIYDLRADAVMPVIKNGDIQLDLRQLAFKTPEGFNLEQLKFKAHLLPTSLSVSDLTIKLPETELKPSDINVQFTSNKDIVNALLNGNQQLTLVDNPVTLSDFAAFMPQLNSFNRCYFLTLNAKGNKNNLILNTLRIKSKLSGFYLDLGGEISSLGKINESSGVLRRLKIDISENEINYWYSNLDKINKNLAGYLGRIGRLTLDGQGSYNARLKRGNIKLVASTGCGNIDTKGTIRKLSLGKNPIFDFDCSIKTSGFNLGRFLDNPDFGNIALNASADLRKAGNIFNIKSNVDIEEVEYHGMSLSDAHIVFNKSGSDLNFNFNVDDVNMQLYAEGEALLAGNNSKWDLETVIENINLDAFPIIPNRKIRNINGGISLHATGNNPDNLTGSLKISELDLETYDDKIHLNQFDIVSEQADYYRKINLNSDWLDVDIAGRFSLTNMPSHIQNMLSLALPSYFKHTATIVEDADCKFDINITGGKQLCEIFNLPFEPLTEVPVSGKYSTNPGLLEVKIDMPYIKQGKNKLIRDTRISLSLNELSHTAYTNIHTIYPAKKGDCELDVTASAIDGSISSHIGLNKTIESRFTGDLDFQVILNGINHSLNQNDKRIALIINPSEIDINNETWKISESKVIYEDNSVIVDNLKIAHDEQYVTINGRASANSEDKVEINLKDVNLDFIFDTLAINYVTFGGVATGKVYGSRLFSTSPVAATEYLYVKDLSYNGARLGDGKLESYWDNRKKEVVIKADISNDGKRCAYVDGGIFVTRDSLSFDLDADKVNIRFIQPFMQAFSSDVNGLASGKAKLYGTFSDIDLVGKLKADTISILLDYTNVYYSGSDSVIMTPGKIEIPNFKIYDAYGNSAMLSGIVTHRYFHDPGFEFKVRDMNSILAYNTNSQINPKWYGRVFVSGSGIVKGNNSIVSIDMDAITERGSNFTFVVDNKEDALDYQFLTFSDKKRSAKQQVKTDDEPDFLKQFRKKVNQQQGPPSIFELILQVRVTNTAQMNLVMDPGSGDKITAYGSGPVQFYYNSSSDEFRMSGKYNVEEGKYRFTLQDIIIKDFIINQGSSVSFNGDPMNANLDINASYRVNTNLTDLDQSFANDRDLNRTNVPVDAVLMVKGPMTSPEVSYDILLPTLTQDVERKVKSIISTEDMMSRQVMYLVALNRFYAPDYTNANVVAGSELASVASSTISSQLGNMMGQLTDKVQLTPSFRSDKGDFSDIEVDLGLSSRLFDNRLIINGNFGYRDRATSTTTFIGDFDVEYLLNKSGNLRLKAYNHFNDQNYYLKSSLTTQGLGIVYRHNFNNLSNLLRRLKRKSKAAHDENKESTDNKQ